MDPLNLLVTVPGIARVSAHALLAELGPEPARVFGSAAAGAACAGVCPGSYHGALQARLGYEKSIRPVTHKLLRVVYAVLRPEVRLPQARGGPQRAALAARPQAAQPPVHGLAAASVPTRRARRANRARGHRSELPGSGSSRLCADAHFRLRILAGARSNPQCVLTSGIFHGKEVRSAESLGP